MQQRDIVVIGASAGGVEALQDLFSGLPPSFPAAVFVVLHIPPHSPNNLQRVLDRAGSLPVVLPADGDPVIRGLVYVATPDRHLLVEKDRIRITRGPRENRMRPAIDVLFRSVAHSYGPRVTGIVLSGNLDDGTAGLWAIKDRGGMALVQTPDDALFPSMPQSAIRQVSVDRVLPASGMSPVLTAICGEGVIMREHLPAHERMRMETSVALGNDPLENSLSLGDVFLSTCPECHGALVQIREGTITRYRCHTGHAFSLETLFIQVNNEIDRNLWSSLRAMNERIMLLQQLEKQAMADHNETGVARYAHEVHESKQRKDRLREMVVREWSNQMVP